MSDIDFEFYAVPNRYVDVIQRMTVLYPLRGVAQTMDGVRFETKQLLNQWRARIGSLSTAGWDPWVNSHHGILYARNCKPTFAINSHRTRPCKNTAICPFCYARWTRDVWQCIDGDMDAPDPVVPTAAEIESCREERVITLDDATEEQPRHHTTSFRFHLVERYHTFYRDILPADNPQGLTVLQNLAGLLDNIERQRSTIIKLVDPAGAFLYTTLEPWNNGQQWKVHHRHLFKMAAGHQFSPEVIANTNGIVQREPRPTRPKIHQIVARICRYPIELMVGDAERTVQLLTARRAINFRSNAKFRSFRNKKTKQE